MGFPAVSKLEFSGACCVLGDLALLDLGTAREEGQRRIALRVSTEDVTLALQDMRLFRNVLA